LTTIPIETMAIIGTGISGLGWGHLSEPDPSVSRARRGLAL